MKGGFIHWFLGVPAVLFVGLFTYLPLYEFVDKSLMTPEDFMRTVFEKNLQPWIFYSREVYIFANLFLGIINAIMFFFVAKFLINGKSIDLLIAFMLFFGIFFLVLLIAGNWLSPGQ